MRKVCCEAVSLGRGQADRTVPHWARQLPGLSLCGQPLTDSQKLLLSHLVLPWLNPPNTQLQWQVPSGFHSQDPHQLAQGSQPGHLGI